MGNASSDRHEIVVLIGAGSAVFTKGLTIDIIERKWNGEIRLVDIDPIAMGVAVGLVEKMVESTGSQLVVKGFTDRREALKGATAVICTVGVGGRRAWERDVFIPRQFDIYQPVGDTVMPGGTSRALRMIPVMRDVARDVGDLCPEALFFNYGNPMSPVCRGIRKATGVPVVGLCHGVIHVAHYLANTLKVPFEQFSYRAAGINHLTWFTEMTSGEEDLMPKLLSIANDRASEIRDGSEVDHPFTWELTKTFGAFPAVLDRHVVEFFPHFFKGKKSYYGKTLGIDAFSLEAVIESGDASYARMTRDAEGADPLPSSYFARSSGEHEQVTDIIESIRRGSGLVFSANLPNHGQVLDLPNEAVVEGPCVAGVRGLTPDGVMELSPPIAGTLASRFMWVETVVEAALSGSIDLVIQALLIDGSVSDVDTCATLAHALIESQKEYLPQFR